MWKRRFSLSSWKMCFYRECNVKAILMHFRQMTRLGICELWLKVCVNQGKNLCFPAHYRRWERKFAPWFTQTLTHKSQVCKWLQIQSTILILVSLTSTVLSPLRFDDVFVPRKRRSLYLGLVCSLDNLPPHYSLVGTLRGGSVLLSLGCVSRNIVGCV